VGVALDGYRPSLRNFSLDRLNPFGLTGRLDADKTDLTYLLDPGERLAGDFEVVPEPERPENLPLCGTEAARTNLHTWVITGQAVDAASKAAVPEFRITPGRQPFPGSSVEWQPSRAATCTGGVYRVELARHAQAVVLLAEAEGFLPALSKPLATNQTTFDFQLNKGQGPRGVLLLPDGQPAAGIGVYYLGPQEQAALNKAGQISVYSYNSNPFKTLTDPEGAFEFPPKLPGGMVIAAGEAGFMRVNAAELAPDAKLTLQPWARIHGKLIKDGQPLAGEDVDLQAVETYSMNQPHLNLHGTRTDDEGGFVIEHVPPGKLQLVTRQKMGQGPGWMSQPQYAFTAVPGADLDAGTVTKKQAPDLKR
jgi:hypothetical protein